MLTRKRHSRTRSVLKGAGVAAGSAGAAALGWLGYSAFLVDHKRALRSALGAPMNHVCTDSAGLLAYYVDRAREGVPLVLLHRIHPAASSYEVRPLFEHYRGTRPVFALDLPGFGFSDRSRRQYTPELYADAILEFLELELGEASDIVALSLAGEFAARAASRRPALFHSLALISPTGLGSVQRGPSDGAYRALSAAPWSQAIFDALTTRPSIRYFLRKSFAGEVDRGLVNYAYDSAHRPNARIAPLHFLGGKLFTPDAVDHLYARVPVPALVLYDRDAFTGFERLLELTARDNWRAERIAGTRGMPHFERLADTADALNRFWSDAAEMTRPAAAH